MKKERKEPSEMTKCFAQMRKDHEAPMKKIKSRKDQKKDKNLTGSINTERPPAAIMPPVGKVGPKILVIVVKM